MGDLLARARAACLRARGWALAVVLLTPTVQGDVVSQLEGAIISFFQSIWNGISNFFGTIFQSIANTFAAIFNAPVNAITASFVSLQTWASGFGPLAPIFTIFVIAAVVLVATVLIWLIIRISVSEGEQTLSEGEEGV